MLNERSRGKEPRRLTGIGQTECRITQAFNEATKALLTATHLGKPELVQFRDEEARFLPGEQVARAFQDPLVGTLDVRPPPVKIVMG